ncbi:hypothetical protein [Subtercola boreus]|nr:hypothetical protein [Subtercola boreus]
MPNSSASCGANRVEPQAYLSRDLPANIDLCPTEPIDIAELLRMMADRT